MKRIFILSILFLIGAALLLGGCGQTSCANNGDCNKASKLICQDGNVYEMTFKGDCVSGTCSFSSNSTKLETDCVANNATCVEGFGGKPKCDTGATYCGVACSMTLYEGNPKAYIINDKIIEFTSLSIQSDGAATVLVDGNHINVSEGQMGTLDDVNYYVAGVRHRVSRKYVRIDVDASNVYALDMTCGNTKCGLPEKEVNSISYCPADCGAVCGDNITTAPEQCDDGNNVSGDGCSSTCAIQSASCGNGICDAGEDLSCSDCVANPRGGFCSAGIPGPQCDQDVSPNDCFFDQSTNSLYYCRGYSPIPADNYIWNWEKVDWTVQGCDTYANQAPVPTCAKVKSANAEFYCKGGEWVESSQTSLCQTIDACDDRIDNDKDGLMDINDPDCQSGGTKEASCTPTISYCTDTDGGLNAYEKGFAIEGYCDAWGNTQPTERARDWCRSDGKLIEQQCVNGQIEMIETICPVGSACAGGACVKDDILEKPIFVVPVDCGNANPVIQFLPECGMTVRDALWRANTYCESLPADVNFKYSLMHLDRIKSISACSPQNESLNCAIGSASCGDLMSSGMIPTLDDRLAENDYLNVCELPGKKLCNDSDANIFTLDYKYPGVVNLKSCEADGTYSYEQYFDSCATHTSVNEYYCDGYNPRHRTVMCDGVCVEGRCLAAYDFVCFNGPDGKPNTYDDVCRYELIV